MRRTNLVVVKSMGKSLGWHGVRLGYAVSEQGRAQTQRAQLPFLNINGLAAFVLKTATRFKTEYHASFARVAEDRCYMTERLIGVPGLTVYPSKANSFSSNCRTEYRDACCGTACSRTTD